MNTVLPGRFTADLQDKEVVLFLIGMRINKFWKIWQWLPVFIAMPLMLHRLRTKKDSGLLSSRIIFYWRGAGVVQYWDSFESLEKFARDPQDMHTKAWSRYRRNVGTDGDVGIWHETYLIGQGNYESVYVNMPVWGLGQASSNIEVGHGTDRARQRLFTRS